MKTLYVADLDGTLLDRRGMLSQYTIQTIRRMTDAGIPFTIATARSLQAANELIWHLGLRLPSILANGSMIFDSVHRRFVYTMPISLDAAFHMEELFDRLDICGFYYHLMNGRVSLYHGHLRGSWDETYRQENVDLLGSRIYPVPDPLAIAGQILPFYVVICGTVELLSSAQQELARICNVSTELYYNQYNDFYFLDIFSSASSKAEGLLELQRMTGAEELVAFGDNFTDIPMLLAADRAYVPRNGILAARNMADEVLDYAYKDSVARFLSREMGWE